MRKIVFAFFLCAVILPGWAQTYLSPNQLGSGNLPSNYEDLVFTLSDGNWTPQVSLPASSNDRDKIKIVSNASFGVQVLQANTDVPIPSLALWRGQSLQYSYSRARGRWIIDAPTLLAADDGKPMQLPNLSGDQRILRAQMYEGAWAPSLNLPSTATDGAVVLINSYAPSVSRIDPANALHASSMPLRNDDNYAFVFNARLGKWVMHECPQGLFLHSNMLFNQMPEPLTALTRFNVPNYTLYSNYRLPTRARDRDRIVITSSQSRPTSIVNSNVQGGGTLTISPGQTYEFMWNADSSNWVVVQAPRTIILPLNHLIGYAMQPIRTRVTEVQARDDNWQPTVGLTQSAQAGDRVVVKSMASRSFRVVGAGAPSPVDYTVSFGDEVAFVFTGSGWTQETEGIRILLTYGQGVSTRFGASAAVIRQLESLRLTNEALENSGARFRFQLAGLKEVPNLGITLNDALNLARTDTIIQTERERVKADAVYYEGVEFGCGLAYLAPPPLSSYMVATGSTACGTTVMRHELGHNMGLDHGNGIIPTAMSGNDKPYFATPYRFDPTLRVPMGHLASVPDEVAIMNRNAPIVARFR